MKELAGLPEEKDGKVGVGIGSHKHRRERRTGLPGAVPGMVLIRAH